MEINEALKLQRSGFDRGTQGGWRARAGELGDGSHGKETQGSRSRRVWLVNEGRVEEKERGFGLGMVGL